MHILWHKFSDGSLFLQTNTAVIKLNLADNWISAEGAGYIAEMLRENCYISELVMIHYIKFFSTMVELSVITKCCSYSHLVLCIHFMLVMVPLNADLVSTLQVDALNYYYVLLYGSVSQRLGTIKFTNLIGRNGNWPRSRFSHLDWHLDL